MKFLEKPPASGSPQTSTRRLGQQGEDLALAYLQRAGLTLVERNYRTPGRGGGEIDLIMKDRDGTLVFVEVRRRSTTAHGGAAASVGLVKQRRLVFAAQHYLLRWRVCPPCRFDVVTLNADQVDWLVAAFDAA
jgi:putative endonuclease